jgi:AcrR family transcriptional regulator
MSQKSPRGRPPGDHDEKRSELVAAALRTIQRLGFEGASMRQIAIEAGCTTGLLTHYFVNKEQLLRQLVDGLFDAMDTWSTDITSQADVFQVVEDILQTPFSADDDTAVWHLWYQLLLKARTDPSLAREIAQRYCTQLEQLTNLFEREQQCGVLRSDYPPRMLAEQVFSVTEGWSLMAPVDVQRFEPGRRKRMITMVIESLKPVASQNEVQR